VAARGASPRQRQEKKERPTSDAEGRVPRKFSRAKIIFCTRRSGRPSERTAFFQTMKTIRHCIVSTILLAAVHAPAQTGTAEPAPRGVLGQNYAELSLGWAKINNARDFYDGSVTGNAAVAPNLDLSGTLGHGWVHGQNEGHATLLSGASTYHLNLAGAKPFASLALGYQSGRGRLAFSDWMWGAGAGCEVPLGDMTLTPRVFYRDDLRGSRRSSQQVTFETEGNWWLNRSTALVASLGYTDVHRSDFDAWNWRVGVRLTF
jgi:hypothetical protein